jgi:predicted nucleotidyltransferase
MFSPSDRTAVRDSLLARARADQRVMAAALVGSSGSGTEDDWSDIDLALKIGRASERDAIIETFTSSMYADHDAVHHLDMGRGDTLFRVFLLASSLQVDLSFWAAEDFRATTPAFHLVFGDAGEARMSPPPNPGHLVGMGWLYALHVRSALARDRPWQATYMLDGMRDQIVALECARRGLPGHEGRGVDRLPSEFLEALTQTRARDLSDAELRRAFAATMHALQDSAAIEEPDLAVRLKRPAKALLQPS